MKTAYDVLGVPRRAGNERIRKAFRKAAKAYHPDLNAGDPTAELQIRVVIAAYEILKTPHKRAAYDRLLRERRRERVRYFAMASVPTLLLGSIVALAISLSVWQSNTHASPPLPTLHSVSAKAMADASQQVAAAENRGRQQVNRGGKSDRGSAPDYGARHRLQVAGSLPPTPGPAEVYAAFAREPGSEANSEAIAFAGRAHETELARRELVLIGAAATPSSNRNAHRTTLAGGMSKFGYDITPSDDGFRILSESGSVVERYRQADGRNHGRTMKVAAHRHSYKLHITSNESQSREHRAERHGPVRRNHAEFRRVGSDVPAPKAFSALSAVASILTREKRIETVGATTVKKKYATISTPCCRSSTQPQRPRQRAAYGT